MNLSLPAHEPIPSIHLLGFRQVCPGWQFHACQHAGHAADAGARLAKARRTVRAHQVAPGPGKSRALMFIALDKLANQKLKQAIIAVPERTIGASFHNEPLSRFGFWADWKVDWTPEVTGATEFTWMPFYIAQLTPASRESAKGSTTWQEPTLIAEDRSDRLSAWGDH
jgi:hypothetical protein